ncbi:5-oxoprolinase [Acrocarpospora pleiomorpha]|uniref:5-oxoprolinase n=1 Tax=Acrocarpospora pleiomorpha TaxID=90975 RepID=A0A5M3Y1V8_9ACTN|nr:hydantoinase B/oxoprolinase family protein [Acrocarpospora pleiomorpha]GES24708.1 5-oxoprolinase [Acrocarpospora pleiomorpha]
MRIADDKVYDPFDLEIVREYVQAATEEMFAVTLRSSQSTMIYEVLDFAVGITDVHGRPVSQGAGLAILPAIFGEVVRGALLQYPIDRLVEGDILISNDPYAPGGTHLNDFCLLMPVFFDGEVVGFAANKAHWIDVGGKEPGSTPVDAAEMFEEGIRVPWMKAFRAGALDESLARLLAANSRAPSAVVGDLHAQAASVRTGARRVQEICARYGPDTYFVSLDRLISETAQRSRAALAEVPHGTWRAEQTIEIGGETAVARVSVAIDDDGMTCDFTGTDPQLVRASINLAGSGLLQACSTVFQAAIGPDVPINAGTYEPLRVVCPQGTFLTAQSPAALSLYFQAIAVAADLVWKALSHVIPERLPAGHFLFGGILVLSGPAPGGGVFVMAEPNPGGWGAGVGADGERALVSLHGGDTLNVPVEVVEQRYPVLIERYGYDTSPGGAGQWRGGEGIVRACRVLSDWAMATPMGDHRTVPTWGSEGGQNGTFNRTEVHRADGTTETHVASVRLMLGEGDVICTVTGKGGGWGDPRRRDPDLVRRDVRDGFVTAADASAIYGVTVDGASL